MKILQINCVYKKGSTGKITYDIHTELQKRGIESVVCYGRGEKVIEPGVYKTCGEFYAKMNNAFSRLTGVMYGGCFFSTKKLISIIQKEKPDVVHLQCINGYFVNIYRLLNWLKANRIRTVMTLHAEFMYTGGCGHSIDCNQWSTRQGCGHSIGCPRWRAETKSLFLDRTGTMWKRMKEAFEGFDEDNLIVVSVSPWLEERAKQSPILADKSHCVVMNGVDNEKIFFPRDTEELRKKHGLTDEKIIFHVTAAFVNEPNHLKGGYYVLQLAKKLHNENVKIFVAGDYDTSVDAPENVVFLGKIMDQNRLAEYYSMADVTLLTSKKETFSMIVAESLCCGTPVVGFKAGAPEQIAIPEFSAFVEYGEVDRLKEKTDEFLQKKKVNEAIAEKADCYSKRNMTENYLAVYRKLSDKEAVGNRLC